MRSCKNNLDKTTKCVIIINYNNHASLFICYFKKIFEVLWIALSIMRATVKAPPIIAQRLIKNCSKFSRALLYLTETWLME